MRTARKTVAALVAALCMAAGAHAAPRRVDIDLTRMSATFVYAQVFNMLIEQEKYEGKSVRMRGAFYVYSYEQDGALKRSYACIVKDATACCAQGLEFEMPAPLDYPDDFPAVGTEITVSGTFHVFQDDGYSRIALVNAQFE